MRCSPSIQIIIFEQNVRTKNTVMSKGYTLTNGGPVACVCVCAWCNNENRSLDMLSLDYRQTSKIIINQQNSTQFNLKCRNSSNLFSVCFLFLISRLSNASYSLALHSCFSYVLCFFFIMSRITYWSIPSVPARTRNSIKRACSNVASINSLRNSLSLCCLCVVRAFGCNSPDAHTFDWHEPYKNRILFNLNAVRQCAATTCKYNTQIGIYLIISATAFLLSFYLLSAFIKFHRNHI